MEKILIADDEQLMRQLVIDFLRPEGYEILEASDGKEALEIYDKEHPDLILLDVMMPGYDGWTVCREIRRESTVPIMTSRVTMSLSTGSSGLPMSRPGLSHDSLSDNGAQAFNTLTISPTVVAISIPSRSAIRFLFFPSVRAHLCGSSSGLPRCALLFP